MLEMPTEEWKKSTADFHPDPEKTTDAVEKIIERTGSMEAAVDNINEALEKDPNNTELRRQASLLANRFDDLAAKLREKTSN